MTDTVQPDPHHPGTAAGEPEKYTPGVRICLYVDGAATDIAGTVIGDAYHSDEIRVLTVTDHEECWPRTNVALAPEQSVRRLP